MNGNTNALHDSPPSLGPTARRTFASNVLDKKTADGSKIVERGESTPHAFAPCNSTHEDPEWPPWLENSIFRLISAVREMSPPPRAHSSAPTNPPSVTVDHTTPTCTAGDGNTESAEDQTEQPRPAKRDTHPPETIQSQKSNTNKIRDSETHDTSEHHFPGGPEMLNNHTIDKQHKVLPTVEHSDRQPLNPPTAWLHAHRSSPPDEDILPKRVADSERYQQQSPTGITLPSASTYPEEQHHQLTQNKPMVTTKAATPATVTKPDSSLPPLRSSTEHTEGASHCPLSTVAEDTVESPVHQPAKHDTLALALTKTTLYTLNRKIIEGLNKTKHIVTHKNIAIASINNSTNITNTVSTVMSDFNVQCHPKTIKNLIVNPLLQCIEEHYFVLEREKHQTSIQLIRETYLNITNNPLFACLTDNIGHMIEETITNAIQYWQNTKLNSREIHPATMESSNTDTVDSAAHKHNVDSTPDCEKSKSGQAADLDNQTSKNNITRPIHTTDSTIASDTSTAANNTQITTQTNKKPKANRKSLKKRKALSRPHAADDCTNPTCFECAKNNIVNLSNITLTRAQILLLSKGLSFIPTATNTKDKDIMRDFNMFANQTKKKLKLMVDPPRTPLKHNSEPDFYRKPTTTTNHPGYNQSQQLGPKALEDAFLAMRQELATLTDDPIQKHNLTRKERLALKQLTTNHDLIINKADKGSTIVVRSTTDYIREGLEHLSDPNTYIQLERDYTQEVTNTIRRTLHKLKINGLLSPKMADFCCPPNKVRTACIYFLKKIHKSPMGIRPIVSTIDSATANLAEFLDIYLQPIMKNLPAYLKDTTHFISEISDIPVQNDTWLVTVDVKSLYTNIPNEEGIQACYEAWQQREITDPQHPPAQVLRHLLEMVLKLNTFEFDNKFYLQKFGTAMGSKLAPAYANTFMGKLEQNILSNAPLKPTYYRRFIDDIFIIWQHSERDLQNFITHMNRANRSIQFTHEKSQRTLCS